MPLGMRIWVVLTDACNSYDEPDKFTFTAEDSKHWCLSAEIHDVTSQRSDFSLSAESFRGSKCSLGHFNSLSTSQILILGNTLQQSNLCLE